MASTSVHHPQKLIERLDALARQSGRSRNRLIREACEAYLDGARETWPDEFLSGHPLERADVKMLQDSLADWLEKLQFSPAGRRAPITSRSKSSRAS